MVNKLFVYGTLAPNCPNEHILTNIGGMWAAGRVKGYLHELGWGATMGYAGIQLNKLGNEIAGFVFISDNLEKNWASLDAFEGVEYKRVLTSVTLENNQIVQAYIYVLSETVE